MRMTRPALRTFARLTTPAMALGLILAPATLAPTPARAQIGIGIGISVHIAPPVLPVYLPPPIPAPGYIFVPGHWLYGDAGYYWVPGTWTLPPQPGLLWTPGYWGYVGGAYVFNQGYWGPHVGYYGGINYGFGYVGVGFFGGEWRGGVFAYNTAAFGGGNVFGGIHNVTTYSNTTVINNNSTHITNISYNGPGGVQARPTPQETAFANERHVPPTAAQVQHIQAAAREPSLRQSVNHGVPAVAASARPGEFKGPGVVRANEEQTRQAERLAKAPAEPARGAAPGRPNGAEPARGAEPGRPNGAEPARAAAERERPAVARPEAATAHPVHPAAAVRPAAGPRPAAAPHPVAPRPAAPHPAAAPRPAAPRPAPRQAPHPEGKEHR